MKVKSAFYFSLIPGLIFGLCFKDLFHGISFIAISTVLLYLLAYLLNQYDLKKETGIVCKICGFDNCTYFYPGRKKGTKVEGDMACSSFDHGFHPEISYCPNCKNGFLKYLGTDSFETQTKRGEELYSDVIDEEYIKNLDARLLTNSKIVTKYKQYFEDKNVLEVGAYYGAFCNEVIKVTDEYTAIEPSRHACEYLNKKYDNVEVFNGTLENYLGQDGSDENLEKFDTIVLFDVIEHVPDPIKTLKNINKILKEDGIVLFSTINIESTFSMLLGPFWPWYMDMHYYYFSDRGYVDMLHRSGYIQKNHHHYSYYVYFSYFLKKVFYILFGTHKLIDKIGKHLRFPIKIALGDTVMIVGKKRTTS